MDDRCWRNRLLATFGFLLARHATTVLNGSFREKLTHGPQDHQGRNPEQEYPQRLIQ